MKSKNHSLTSEQNKYNYVICVTNDITYDRRILRLAKSLNKNGKSVLIIGRAYKKDYPDCDDPEIDILRITCLVNRGPFFYLEYNIRLIIALSRLTIEYLTCVDLDTILAGYLFDLRKRSTIKVFDANEYFTEVPELSQKQLVRWFWTQLGQWAIPSFDGSYTVNDSLAGILSSKYKTDFKVIRNLPWRQSKCIQQFKNKRFTFVYLGVLNPDRGLHELIDIIKEMPIVDLWLIGDGPLKEDLHRLAEGSLNIRFWGMMAPEEIHSTLCKCHVGINLLDGSSLSYKYSLANKFFDYVQAELPIITMDYPEYKKIYKQYKFGILLPEKDGKKLHNALIKIHRDAKLYNEFRVKVTKMKVVYNWENESERLTEFYKNFE